MDISLLLSAISTLTLVVALVFGAIQVVYLRRARRDQAAVEMIHSMQLGAFADAWRVVLELPPEIEAGQLVARGQATVEAADKMALTFETLGYMVYRRIIPLKIAEDLVGGMVTESWRRLRHWAEQSRVTTEHPALMEWFQWLNDRLLENRMPSKVMGHFAPTRIGNRKALESLLTPPRKR
jgi:hypothetical protein